MPVTPPGGNVSGRGGAIYTREDLTVNNSTISGNEATVGGGISNQGGPLNVRNSTIRENLADDGGGIDNVGSTATTEVNLSTVSGNEAVNGGGGISNRAGNVTVRNSVISGNKAIGGVGAGIHNKGGTAAVTSSTIRDNQANDFGGGIFSSGNGVVTVNGSFILVNSASRRGGGISNQGDNATVVVSNNSIISGNSADIGSGIDNSGIATVNNSAISGNLDSLSGGGIYNSGTAQISNSTIGGNSAYFFGGGIWNVGNATVHNSTISGNLATGSTGRGGAILNGVNGAVSISNSTISENIASLAAGGIYNVGDATIRNSTISGNKADRGGGVFNSGTVNLSNTIIAGNTLTAGGASDIAEFGTGTGTATPITSGSFNLIGDAATAGGLSAADHNIVGVDWTDVLVNNGTTPTLADHGGPTQTIELLAGSPAINAGNDELTTDDGTGTGTPLTTDQRGASFTRIVGGTVDIGAFEVQVQALELVVDTDTDIVDGNYTPGNLSLREAVLLTNANPGFSHTITFGDGSAAGGTNFTDNAADTITLEGTELAITGAVTITGPGPELLTIDANDRSRILNIDDGDNGSQSTVSISGLTLSGGKVSGENNVSYGGGAIFTREDLTVSSSTISGNSVAGLALRGGGIANFGSYATVRINNSTVTGNSADFGGGISNDGGTLTVSNSTVNGNTAGNFGGGIFNVGGEATVSSSTISGNSADGGGGGGIFNVFGGTVSVSNSTISHNKSVNSGGAVLNLGASVTISNGTISGNKALNSGGGVSNVAGSTLNLSNTIVAGNTLTPGSDSDISESGFAITSGSFNLIGTGVINGLTDGVDGNIVGVDWRDVVETTAAPDGSTVPLLTDNGGLTQTIALVDGGPAAGAGNNALVPSGTDFDQRGAPFQRIAGGSVDIGAFELLNSPPVANTVSLNATEDGPPVTGSFSETDADTTDTHTFTISSQPAEGSVENNNDGTFTFDPGTDFQDLAEGETRDVTFQYTATDDSGTANATSEPATVTVTVTGTNDQPVADAVSLNATEDGPPVTGSFSETDADTTDTHTFTIICQPADGSPAPTAALPRDQCRRHSAS